MSVADLAVNFEVNSYLKEHVDVQFAIHIDK